MADKKQAKAQPQSYEAEQSVLGACLVSVEAVHEVLDRLTDEVWYWPKHKLIWQAITELADKQEPADLVTVTQTLRAAKHLDKVGGDLYLDELMDACPFPGNVVSYAGVVLEKYRLRAVFTVANEVSGKSYEPDADPEQLIDAAMRSLQDLSRVQGVRVASSSQTSIELMEDLERLSEARGGGVQTTYKLYDDVAGWWQRAEMVILAGRPKMGKTAAACDIARRNASRRKVRIAYYGGEMPARHLKARMISGHASEYMNLNLPYSWMLTRPHWVKDNLKQIQQAVSSFESRTAGRIQIFDGRQPVERVASTFKAMRRDHPEDTWLFIVDYLQRLDGPRRMQLYDRTDWNVSRLKDMAQQLDAPVLVLAQFNRAPARDRGVDAEPEVHELLGGGVIEQEADRVMILHRPALPRDPNTNEPVADDVHERKLIQKIARNAPTARQLVDWLPEVGRLDDGASDDRSYEHGDADSPF